jgi:tetratricopeptide (TPR) repeat protein
MGNINTKKNLILAIPQSIGKYILICNDILYKGYKLFINISDNKLNLILISFHINEIYNTSINLSAKPKMDLFSEAETLEDIRTIIENIINDNTLGLTEKHNTLKLFLTSIKNKKSITLTFCLTTENKTKDDRSRITSTSLLDNLIPYCDIEADLTEINRFKSVIQLYNESKYEDCLNEIGEPEDDFNLLFKSLCLLKLERYKIAFFGFMALSCHINDNINLYFKICKKYLVGGGVELFNKAMKLSDNQKKLEYLDKAIEINSNYSKAYYERGNIFLNLSELEKAINCYDKAIETNFTEPLEAYKAYNNKGIALAKLRKHDEAIECLNKAKKSLDNSKKNFLTQYYLGLIYCNKGNALLSLGRFEEALECYSDALNLYYLCYSLFLYKGIALFYSKDFNSALEYINKSIDINKEHNPSHKYKDLVLLCMERYDEAKECFNKAILINPDDDMAYYYYGYALYCLSKYEEASQYFDKAKEVYIYDDKIPYNKIILNDLSNISEIREKLPLEYSLNV